MSHSDVLSPMPDSGDRRSSRRSILKWAGAAAASAAVFGVDVPGLKLAEAFAQTGAVDLGGGDVGVLNYAYALEQLEAAFYTQVVASPYEGMSGYERSVLRDIRDHEIAHRAFFAKALGRNRIPNLTPNFSAVDFGSRRSVLTTASTFEDLGVSAYNGGGQAIKNPAYLAAAGSIVSVEARHAAVLRDLIQPLSSNFAGYDVVNFSGLDVARPPSQVLMAAAPFIATPITATQLP
ncbi:ferritin-like domain-containing protein [Tardiphaga sp. vice154]|uniref:ferritin-like domain-containing protein n=1 Tax=Tardiphaga sp. vice154 TaxID=2592814 RepID=UPI001164736C|nr:ferritin-like domain-containing protein [Tardiphaga sp. vice154]QDM24187.1 ferritin-like domain-containing protein [Tardiphaga sp. vice154]